MTIVTIPYSVDILPKGFVYPSGYLNLANDRDSLRRLIWWFPTDEYEQAASEWEMRLYWKKEGWHHLNNIDPIPFARNGDWAAFFDGNDHSGDPKVVVVDLGNKQNSYRLENFHAWLDVALKDSGLK